MPDASDASKLEDWATVQMIPDHIVDGIANAALSAYRPKVEALEAEVDDLRASLDERDDLIAALREQLAERPVPVDE